jgi:hypothetical protein
MRRAATNLLGTLSLLALGLLGSCGSSEGTPPVDGAWAYGTVLSVDGATTGPRR